MTAEYFLVSESVLGRLISGRSESPINSILSASAGIARTQFGTIEFLATGNEDSGEFLALIDAAALKALRGPADVAFTRIARVLKAAARPPVHLPRGWSEFHHKNRIAFFASTDNHGYQRWLSDIDGIARVVRFLEVYDDREKLSVSEWVPKGTPSIEGAYWDWVSQARAQLSEDVTPQSFSGQVDLKVVGSDAVVQGHNYEYWHSKLKPEQLRIVESDPSASVRVIGPAGSGKTLTLCMRAIRLARDPAVVGERKKILVVTHSWAMTERINGVLEALSDGQMPDSISVVPLLYVLQAHAGTVSQTAHSVLGEDSADGQRRVLDLLERIVGESGFRPTATQRERLSPAIVRALDAAPTAYARAELVLDLYEEIVGVLSPQGILPDDTDRVAEYLISHRDDTLPPFHNRTDRELCLRVFSRLLEILVDLESITTDQLVLDCIRVFETFSWNVRRETDGYDFILIDELQLFDAQERLAVSLLSRAKPGMVFLSVEDPSQGLFSVVNDRSKALKDKSQVYLEETHRFRSGLFEFISFIYSTFPLNATPLRVAKAEARSRKPRLAQIPDSADVIQWCVDRVKEVAKSRDKDRRVCIVCMSDVEQSIYDALMQDPDCAVVRLQSFDDVEMLSYQRRAAVISSWQFIGGTQFSDVVLVCNGLAKPSSAHAKLREKTAIYLGASRASSALDVLCDLRIPEVLQTALKQKLIIKER